MAEDFVLERAKRRARRAREARDRDNDNTSDTGIVDQFGEAVRAPVSTAESLITGKGRVRPGDRDVPELPDFRSPISLPDIALGKPSILGGDQAADVAPDTGSRANHPSTSRLMAFAKTDAGKLGILKRLIPGIEHESDDAGNIVVTIGDDQAAQMRIKPGRYFLNRPGISGQDVNDIVNSGSIELFTSIPGAKLGLKALGKLGQALGLSGGLSAGSVVQDLLAGGLGSNKGIDEVTAVVAGLFGITGAALAALGNKVIPGMRAILRSPLNFDDAGRGLNARGRRAVRNMGADPDTVTNEAIQEFDNLTLGRRNPQNVGEATAAAEASSLPVDVPMRPGDLSGDVASQSAESSAAKGAFDVADTRIRAEAHRVREAQSTALDANRAGVQGRVAGRDEASRVGARGAGIEEVQRGLKAGLDAAKDAVDKAFILARRGKSLRFDKEPLENFAAGLREQIERRFVGGLPEGGATMKALDFLEGRFVLGRVTKKGSRVPTVGIKELEQFRANANRLKRGLTDPVERKALGFVIKSFENAIDKMIETPLTRGDIGTLMKYRNARFLRRKMGEKFESNKMVSALVEVSKESGEEAFRLTPTEVTFRLTPTEATNYLFSASAIGAKKGAAHAVRKLKGIFGVNSPEWKALQEEAIVRLFEEAKKGTGAFVSDASRTYFSGRKFRTALDKAMKEAPEVMHELFTKRDLDLLQQFKRVAMRATTRVEGAVNASNSTIKLISYMTNQPGMISAILQKFIGFIPANVERAAARQAISTATKRTIQEQGKQRTGSIFGVGGASLTTHRRRRRGPQTR